MIKQLFLVLVLALSVGCTTAPDGTEVANTVLIQDMSALGAVAIVNKAEEEGLDIEAILHNIQHVKHQVQEYDQNAPFDVIALYEAFGSRVPQKYQTVAQLTLVLIKNHVEPILQSELAEIDKDRKVREVVLAVLTGVETGLRLHLVNKT